MHLSSRFFVAAFAAASAFLPTCLGQEPVMYTDPESGVTLGTWVTEASGTQGEFVFGMALPEDALTTDATEYIGLLRCSGGWCGVSHGLSGQMTNALLLVAWQHEGQVLTSFRFTSSYQAPPVYSGDAKLTQIASWANETGFEVIYRCQGCFSWDHEGVTGSVSTSGGLLVLGRAQASTAPENTGCPDEVSLGYHNGGFGQWGAPLDQIASPSYAEWADLATETVEGDCGGASVLFLDGQLAAAT